MNSAACLALRGLAMTLLGAVALGQVPATLPVGIECTPASGPLYTANPSTLQAVIDGIGPLDANSFILLESSPGADYPGLVIDDPTGSITLFTRQGVTGAPNPNVRLGGAIQIRNLKQDMTVLLRGIDDNGAGYDHVIDNNQGVVWIEACSLVGNASGLAVRDSRVVSLVRNDLEGRGPGSSGLLITTPGIVEPDIVTSVALWGGTVRADSDASGNGLVAQSCKTSVFADGVTFLAGAAGAQAHLTAATLHHLGTNLTDGGILTSSKGKHEDEGCGSRSLIAQSAVVAGDPSKPLHVKIQGASQDDYSIHTGTMPWHVPAYLPSVPIFGGGPACGMSALDPLGAPTTQTLPFTAPMCGPSIVDITVLTQSLCEAGGQLYFAQSYYGGHVLDASCVAGTAYSEATWGAPTSIVLYQKP